MKNTWKKLIAKTYVVGTGALLALSPKAALAAAPSTYVNSIADGLFREILSIAPKIALVVIALSLVFYFASGDDHKKSKYKGTMYVAIACYLILLVLKPLMDWFSGLI